jgi:thiamine biosynthesis lipoprotein
MNRRDFLHSRQLAHSAGQVLAALDGEEAVPSPSDEVALVRLSRQAMATTFEIILPFGTPHAVELAAEAFDLLDALEDQLSVYRDHSEVSRLNQRAFLGPVVVEQGLFALLQRSTQISVATRGAFDVTAGALIKAWGFFRGPRRVPAELERAQALGQVGSQWLCLEPQTQSVQFLRPGLEINLGSIGKGYALDRMAQWLSEEGGLSAFVLHGGSSSVYAKGCFPGDERGWVVGIRHPWVPGRRLAQVCLRDQALGTSAATFQHLVHEGRKLGHILDPRSGWPAEGMASSTVLAATASEADALATAFYILGVEEARTYCAAHSEVAVVLLPQSPAGPPVFLGLSPAQTDLVAPGI